MLYDYLIYIGRFQPVHSGHVHVIREALKISKNLIIVLGSHQKAPDIRNPLPTRMRIQLIKASLTPDERERVEFAPQVDHTYNDDRWIASIQASVNTLIHRKFTADPINIGIVGYEKDHTSFYLRKFPQYEFVKVPPLNMQNSTDFRRAIFERNTNLLHSYCQNTEVFNILAEWMKSEDFDRLEAEWLHVKDYKEQWAKSPYAPTFVTVDAVIRQSGHLLVVTRKAMPGAGLWALPGGFVGQTETLEEAVLREVYEETRLAVPKPALKGSLVKHRTFDDPHRSTRGRTITECFDFKLNENYELPHVKGSDDAEKAFWLPFDEVVRNRDRWFEDHFAMIETMVGL